MRRIVKRCACCLRGYCRDEFEALPLVHIGFRYFDDEPLYQLRNCVECSSTLALAVSAPPNAVEVSNHA